MTLVFPNLWLLDSDGVFDPIMVLDFLSRHGREHTHLRAISLRKIDTVRLLW